MRRGRFRVRVVVGFGIVVKRVEEKKVCGLSCFRNRVKSPTRKLMMKH